VVIAEENGEINNTKRDLSDYCDAKNEEECDEIRKYDPIPACERCQIPSIKKHKIKRR